MQKGQIRVQTENIFPIIKKFLYSEHEIFLRELVSNAVDASQKLKAIASIGEAKGEIGEMRIDIVLDAKEKTLSIIDKGIGMTADEVDKYINQVAFSSAEEFLHKYKDAKKPSELTALDYQNFYKELYPYSELPLFWIHLNVDYPFNLTGVLYFPKIKQTYEIQKDKIQLYSNQVFVTDEVKDIVPEFLMLLHGVIDSPDIPLNVSRSLK